METIEQTLDNWLNEFTDNKHLYKKLKIATEAIKEPDATQMVCLTKRDIETLLKGLKPIIMSNKESIIDCSYNFIQEKKK